MRIFDNHKKINWSLSGCEIINREVVIPSGGKASSIISGSGTCNMTIIGKKISGDGEVVVKIVDVDRVFFKKKITFTTKSSSEFSMSLGKLPPGVTIEVSKNKNSIGRALLERVVINSEDSNIEIEQDFLNSLSAYRLDSKYTPTVRVAVIVPYSIYGGGEVYLKNILENIPGSFDVTVLYMAKNKLQEKLSSDVRHIEANTLKRLSDNLILHNYDCIVYYNSLNIYNTISSLKKANKFSSKIFEIYHSDFIWSDAVAKLRKREGVSAIFRIDENLANDISSINKLRKIHLPTGIDIDRFKKLTDPILSVRDLGIDGEKIIFGTVARLSPEKNLLYTIDLVSNMENAHLIIVGSGPDENKIKKYIKNNENITLVEYTDKVEDYYNIFDAFILTSKIEGMPISILEAMSTGLQIFTTDVGAIKSNIGSLNGVNMLTGDLGNDLEIISKKAEKDLFFENLRLFIESNHNSAIISTKFFLGIIDGSLNYVYNTGIDTFNGEYI